MINQIALSLVTLMLLTTACAPGEKKELDFGPGGDTPSNPDDQNPNIPKATSIQISWTRPLCRVNSTPLPIEEIGGYKLYFGFQEKIYEPAIDIANNQANTYTFPVQSNDTFHFAIESYDTDDLHSSKSESVIVKCQDGECQRISPPSKPPVNNCNNEVVNLAQEALSFKVVKNIKNDDNRPDRIMGQASCPAFPLKDKTKQNISLIKDAYRISLGRNAKIIQCGWRRHHTPETRKKHLVGYKKVNLHLPIYQMTTPIKFKNKIYIPYDLVLMDKKQKEKVALEAGAQTKGLKVLKALREVPLFRNSSRGSSHYDQKRLRGSFALINNSTYLSVDPGRLRICENDNENDKPGKNCISANDLSLPNYKMSSFTKRQIKRNRIPVIVLKADENIINEVYEQIKTGTSTIDIFQNLSFPGKTKYVSYSLALSGQEERQNYKNDLVKTSGQLDILKKILQFDHTNKIEQALRYFHTAQTKLKLTADQIKSHLPELINYATDIWSQEKQTDNELKALALDLLNIVYPDPSQNPVGEINTLYKLIKPMTYSPSYSLQVAQRMQDLGVDKVKQIIKDVNALKEEHFQKFQLLEVIEKIYRSPLADSDARIQYAIDTLIKLTERKDGYYFEGDIDLRYFTGKLTNYIQEFNITENQINLLRESIKKVFKIKYSDTTCCYDPYNITSDVFEESLAEIENLIFTKQLKQKRLDLVYNILDFLYSSKYVYMYSFDEAYQLTLKYIFEDEITASQFYGLRGKFTYWTSRGETFLQDKQRALNLAYQEYVNPNELVQKRYYRVSRFYNALKHYKHSSLRDKRNALNSALSFITSSSTPEEKYQFQLKIIRWFTNNFSKFLNSTQKMNKLKLYLYDTRISERTFERMEKTYRRLIKKGNSPKLALRKIENRFIYRISTDEDFTEDE